MFFFLHNFHIAFIRSFTYSIERATEIFGVKLNSFLHTHTTTTNEMISAIWHSDEKKNIYNLKKNKKCWEKLSTPPGRLNNIRRRGKFE
jgi:hypothetical protein